MLKQLGPSRNRFLKRLAHLLAKLSAKMGWLSVRYPSIGFEQRLADFKSLNLDLQPGTEIRFNEFFVPYIVAQSDSQAAYALGAVAEFQRGPQLQFLKRLAQGRLSEMGGAGFVDMDHLIRLLGFGNACAEMWANMPEPSKVWVRAYVDGLNTVQAQRPRGVDEKLLGIRPERFSPLDILLLGRLAGADVNWSIYFALIEQRQSADFVHWWNQLRQFGSGIHTSFDNANAPTPTAAQRIADFLAGLSRSGSNSMVLSGQRTASGHPLMVNDPHLGQHVPNVWMMVGLHSPSYQCVGLMFPGVPVLGLGRNPRLAWGGTNLRAASSDLVHLGESELLQTSESITRIKVRWAWWRSRKLRASAHGPLLTDCPALGRLCGQVHLALRWAGHWPTDEVSSFLQAMRANGVGELHDAMAGVGVTPLNVLGADVDGNIGHVLAATLPMRNGFPENDWVLSPEQASSSWARQVCARDFPSSLNPAEGYLVSANNRPSEVQGLGFLFNGDDRIARARSLFAAKRRFTPAELLDLQLDVTSPLAEKLASALAEFCRPHVQDNAHLILINSIDLWTGAYETGSMPALQFEFLLAAMVRELAVLRHGGRVPTLMMEWTWLSQCLLGELEKLDSATRAKLVPACIEEASRLAQKWQLWGNAHKIRLRHVLGHVPILGKLFSARSFPAAGSRETLMKNAHGLIQGYDESSYGSQSRHLSDLSDLDANFFVLLGGQDGWVGSQSMLDQIPLWQTRQSIQMPLRLSTIQDRFPHVISRLE